MSQNITALCFTTPPTAHNELTTTEVIRTTSPAHLTAQNDYLEQLCDNSKAAVIHCKSNKEIQP